MNKGWVAGIFLGAPFVLGIALANQTHAMDYKMNGNKQPLTIERINASPALAGKSPRGLKLSPDGKRVTYLVGRESNQSFYDLWQMDVNTGTTSILVNADMLASGELSNEEKARRERQRIYGQGIMEYDWAADSQSVLIPASGKLYLYSLTSNKVKKLSIGERFATDAKLSPKGHYVSFIRDQNLFVLRLKDNQLVQMTQDGGGAIKNGMAEFVAQEEMGRYTGYWWADDEAHIAYARVDESGVELVTRNEIYADGIKLTEQRYPYAGKTNVKIKLGITELSTLKTQWVNLGKETDIYLPRVKWLPDGKDLSFQWQSRDQKTLKFQVVSINDVQHPTTLITEISNAWVNLNKDLHFLKKQNAFIWASERDGFEHLYLFNDDGKLIRQLTKGEWTVDSLEYVDETNQWVYFTGRKRYAYRTSTISGSFSWWRYRTS